VQVLENLGRRIIIIITIIKNNAITIGGELSFILLIIIITIIINNAITIGGELSFILLIIIAKKNKPVQ
jgi:predicted membrane protein